MPFGGLGMWEVLLILLALLLVFGPRRLPELGGALGKGIREFKRSVTDIRSELMSPGDEKKELKAPARTATPEGEAAQPAQEQSAAAPAPQATKDVKSGE